MVKAFSPFFITVLCLVLLGCVSDNALKVELNMTPVEQSDGWEIGLPGDEGLDNLKLNAIYEDIFSEQDFVMTYSLLIVKNNKLVAEGYTQDLNEIDRLVQIKSVTKSILSLVFGIFLDENPGIISDIRSPLKEEYVGKEHFVGGENSSLMTIEDLLTMRSGLAFDNGSDSKKMILSTDQKMPKFILSRAAVSDPGLTFNFSDGDAQLIADLLFKLIPVSGLSFDAYVNDRLFEPLGIDDFIWEKHAWDTQRPFGGFGLYLKPRDLARLGQLVLNGGEWEGVQLVPKQWIIDATNEYVSFDDGGYGYYWWVRDFGSMAYGEGGQTIYIVPENDIVVVMTGNPFSNGLGASKEKIESVVTDIIRALDES